MDDIEAYYQKYPEIVEAVLAALKRAQLKKKFLISNSELYDYYSTNSGIFAANPAFLSGGGGGDDPDSLAGRVSDLETTMVEVTGEIDGVKTDATTAANATRRLKQAFSDVSPSVSSIPGDIPSYDDIDEITSAAITLKNAVLSINNEIQDN